MVGMWGFYDYIKFGQLGNLDPHQATVKVTTSMIQWDERKYSGGPAYKLTWMFASPLMMDQLSFSISDCSSGL